MFAWKNAMLRTIVALCLTAPLVIPTVGVAAARPSYPSELITYVNSPGIGEIAVQVRVPETPRYPEGAGVVVEASTFWVDPHGFYTSADVTELGLIHIAYLWPGKEDPCGAKSGGTFDYGGEESIRALRDVIRFAAGQIPNRDGLYLEDLIAITPLNDTVGLYAFSHPGIAAVNVLALHGDQLSVGYFVGRENPTLDVLSAVEMGHWAETGQPVFNPLYIYPQGYTPTRLVIDYSSVRWDPDYEDEHIPYVGRPYFDLNSNGQRDEADYVLGHRGSVMFDKRNYSIPLTRALRDNGAIDEADWPSDLATPEEVEAIWSFRSSVHRYPHLATKTPDLKVMLVFARHDHVQPARDKPHIHQAYDGFHHAAGLWTRLNPDQAYVEALDSGLGQVSPEHPANAEPNDWLEIEAWGHADGQPGNTLVPLAAVAEMADRVRANNWDADLDEVLVEYPPPQPTPRRVYLPLLMKDWFGEPTVTTDVTFAVVEGESLALDAYLPATPGPHPAVILIHGGYWQTGDKESHSRLGKWMAGHGYAAFAVNYRLAPQFPFPTAVADVQCAVAWVREHAAEHDVDPDRLALMGTSAGGHLAALAALAAAPASPAATWQPSCGDPAADVSVQAVISCFGPVDLAFHAQESEGAEDIVAVFLGGQACQDAPQLCAAASPMTYATADAPPTLLIHGTDDHAVSCENSARLYAALDGVGAEVTYLPVEGAQHGFIVGVQSPKAQAALDAVADFLAATFPPSPSSLPPRPLSLVPSPSSLIPIDIDLPSDSTGSPTGTLAVRVHTPTHGHARYPEGAPVLIWGAGGFEVKGINHDLPASVEDIILVTFVYPGGEDPWSGRSSDGVYDYRGPNCIAALRDVILYAAGELTDSQGRTIDDVVPVPVLHDNIGLEGVSNGGNIIVAVAALFGDELTGHLRYIIQWETPVSSQIATRDLGRVWLQPPHPGQGDFFNPRYQGYGPKVLAVDYSDLTYDPDGPLRKVFHDGNGDGEYTTIEDPGNHLQTPDLNLDGVLDLSEDFPLDTYPAPPLSPPTLGGMKGGLKEVYSRAVTHALADNQIMPHPWPHGVATPSEADAYWDIREAVRLYDDAVANVPGLEAMVLCGVRDHVQSAPTKPHIQQAFEGWLSALPPPPLPTSGEGEGGWGGGSEGSPWVQINPSPAYLIEADPSLAGRDDLPNRVPNTPPGDWGRVESYCVPEDIPKATYQLAAVWQMADRAQGVFTPTPAGAELITYVDSPPSSPPTLGGTEGGRIAVRIEVPEQPRYPEGAPVVVEASTWFVPGNDFHRVNQTTEIGALTVSYLWPERVDAASGARSEGVYDYGGPRSLEVLRDVIRFASGLIPNVDGYTIDELVDVTPLTDNVGLFASSHAGVVATNVLAHHGSELPTVKYLVGRENPTRDEMYPLELGHFDEQRHPVYNPFYDEDDYHPTTVTVDYSTVGWYQPDPQSPGRPYFAAGNGHPEYILDVKGPTMWGKRYYSRAITQALLDNGALTLQNWPQDLATPAEAQAAWPFRITVHNYPAFATQAPDLKVMLVFAQDDHVQAAETKPHIHQAWDGFTDAAGLSWVRMNPDLAYADAYVQAINPGLGSGFPDNAANSEPADWRDIRAWGFPAGPGRVRQDVWLASVAEMADRVREDNWDADLDQVLVEYPPTAHRVFLSLVMK